MDILYSEKAVKSMKKIAKGDKKSAQKIIEAIENYANNPNGAFDIKALKGNFGFFKRIRVGNYRIIFDENINVINIYDIKHRQEIYND
ncbi:MAG: hypothetical protein A2015_04725 [Spirochaetes bacterium GWF1_31_7]|nr:MAG: hypothetical protein A2Y30_05105 [Spirochaetes bacterium GWE1_32_154]OHD48773.1 MAG: hypothetical protein A2Y29_03080 [Spirochaetes bacterium GWE2_31_10]OHD52836.1 MAG: hypothetical protein A2015_04725 [Spirochaetes bacterium GWF1_31_7]OHD81489.1 MAG: hypothetical protein A2355_00780 [Spirochaetes bacterium RIFOXYB1_FULL_32_8]HBD95186.1 hypothetical protein [Spirochaetia bacterium]